MDFRGPGRYRGGTMRRLPLLALLFLSLPMHASAAAPSPTKAPSAVQALSVYPADIRQATVGVLAYPGTLVQLAQIQAKTSAAFRTVLATAPQDTQKKLWRLLRYPKLVEDLAAFGPQSGKSVKQIDAAYPKDLQPIASDLSQNHYDLLRKTADLNRQAGQEFRQALQTLPDPAQKNFQTVAAHSEIFHILSQSLQLDKAAPDSFKKDPKPLTQKAQALAQQLQQAPTAAHPETWKGSAGDDPKAVAALQKTATAFEKQNDAELDEDPNPKGAVQANVGFTPYSSVFVPVGWAYPFWFGWPDWDPYPYW